MSKIKEYAELTKELIKFKLMGVAPMEAILKIKESMSGVRNLNHKVFGKICHPDADGGTPISGLEVELWDRDIIGDDYLGHSITDKEGNFEILYDPADAGLGDKPDFELKIFDPPVKSIIKGEPGFKRQIIEVIKGANNVKDPAFNMGTIELEYYEYEKGNKDVKFPFSRRSSIRRDFVPGGAATFAKSMATYGPIDTKLLLSSLRGKKYTSEEVQNLYPPSQTIKKENDKKGSSRDDDYFIQRLMNGFYPAKAFRQDAKDSSKFTIGYNWDSFNFNGYLDLPNFRLDIQKTDAGFKPVGIGLQLRQKGEENLKKGSPMQDENYYTPSDNDKWLQAKRVFRAYYFGVVGQLKGHVAEGHFNMEQYAMSMSRNLKFNPVRDLLFPHLKEVININDKGRDLLLGGETGIFPRAKPILMSDQLDWIPENLGKLDWADWQPRKPMYKGHTYAESANLYWSILTQYINEYFEKHKEQIEARWYEVLLFSNDLVHHSVQFSTHISEDLKDDRPYFDLNEFDSSKLPRKEVDGIIRSVRPITESMTPDQKSIENLKQVCRYAIFHTTFFHSWFHQEQNNEFGELKYSVMLRNGCMAPEEDENILPPTDLLSMALRTTNTLQDFSYGFLLKNEDGDVPDRLVELVKNNGDKFIEIGFKNEYLRSRMNA